MQKTLIFALHGFLGSSEDWLKIKKQCPKYEWITPNLFSDDRMNLSSFESVTFSIIDTYEKTIELYSKRIFIGYSLGGRIGLHLLKHKPNLFDHYIFLSTHPGLTEPDEIEQRQLNDQHWIEKLKKLYWEDFLKEWNSQQVFAGDINEPVRNSEDYISKKLIQSLDGLSLARQKNMRPCIQKFQSKITWFVGEKDKKFSDLAEKMKQKKILLDYKRIPSGHRILLENSTDFFQMLDRLVD